MDQCYLNGYLYDNVTEKKIWYEFTEGACIISKQSKSRLFERPLFMRKIELYQNGFTCYENLDWNKIEM